jgi:heterotetrameric sarcosine oxidase gamma subunit
MAIARSPITQAPPVALVDGWEVSARRSSAPLRLIDCTPCRKFLIRAAMGTSAVLKDVARGRAGRDDSGALVAGIGYEEWLLIGSPDLPLPTHLTASLNGDDELITIVDLTHARALVRMVGTDSAKVMSKLCAIDFSDRISPDKSAFRTSMAGLVVEVVRSDLANPFHDAVSRDSTLRSYLMLCERSAGQYLFNILLDAGHEFGIDVEGFRIDGL